MYSLPTSTTNINYWLMPLTVSKKILANEFITAQDVINAGCEAFGFTKLQLLSDSRQRDIVRARNIVMYVMRLKVKVKVKVKDNENKMKQISLKSIGKLFNRNHTSIMHSLRSVENDLSVTAYRQQMNMDIRKVMERI